jgi:hypothetical protein
MISNKRGAFTAMDTNFEAEIRRKLKVQSPDKVLRGAPPNRSDSTVSVYIRQLKTVYASGDFGPDVMNDLDWIEDHEQVISTIESLTSRDGKLLKSLTKSNYAAPFAILAAGETQSAYSKYMQRMKPTEEELDHSMQRKTPKEVDNWVPWAELLEKRSELDDEINCYVVPRFHNKERLDRHDKQLVMDHLILSLYTMPLGPLRNEYAECIFFMRDHENDRVAIEPGDINVVELKDDPKHCFFHIGRHKTLEKDGVRRLEIPKDLVKVILRSFNLIPRKHLILKRHYLVWKDEPVSNFTVVLNDLGQRHFGRNLSCTLLRHISHTEQSPKLMSRGEVRAKAQYMGHSMRTADELYNRRFE